MLSVALMGLPGFDGCTFGVLRAGRLAWHRNDTHNTLAKTKSVTKLAKVIEFPKSSARKLAIAA